MMKKKACSILLITVSMLLAGCAQQTTPTDYAKASDISALSDQISVLQEDLQEGLKEDSSDTFVSNEAVALSEKELKPEAVTTKDNVILTITNTTNKAYSSITATIIYYDSSNNILSYTSSYFGNVFPGAPYMTCLPEPVDRNNAPVPYDHYEITYTGTVFDQDMKNYANQVEIVSNIGANGGVIAKCYNHSDVTLTTVEAYAIFYKKGTIVGVSQCGFNQIVPGQYSLTEFGSPYSYSNYQPIAFDDYKIVVTSATVYFYNMKGYN